MRRLRILIADDHPHIRAALQTLLEPAYHVVGTAENGQAAVEAAQALRPDLVLLDVDVPILDGIEAARELHRQCPESRLIFYSSHGEPELMAAAFAAGATGYVIKGSDMDLLSTIQPVIRQLWKNDQDLSVGHCRTSLLMHDAGEGGRMAERLA